jgi:uncharacterized membrane protein
MSEIIVLAFPEQHGAERVLAEIGRLQREKLIVVDDAATVVRGTDGKPKIKQATSLVGPGALGGAFWGMLIGLLFFVPFLGLAVGAITGALAGKFTDYGIDDTFIKEVSQSIEPGQSALFLLVREATMDKVLDALRPYGPQVIRTSLSKEQEARLREAFAPDGAAATQPADIAAAAPVAAAASNGESAPPAETTTPAQPASA